MDLFTYDLIEQNYFTNFQMINFFKNYVFQWKNETFAKLQVHSWVRYFSSQLNRWQIKKCVQIHVNWQTKMLLIPNIIKQRKHWSAMSYALLTRNE